MKKSLLIIILMTTSLSAFALSGGKGNGGDSCENRIISIREDIKEWLINDGQQNLTLPEHITPEMYKSKMLLNAIENYSISCTQRILKIGQSEKTCINYKNVNETEDEHSGRIECNFERFNSLSESEQYRLIHHEYAGAAGFEINEGKEESQYFISNQISGFLVDTVVKRLSVISIKVPFSGRDMQSQYEYSYNDKRFLTNSCWTGNSTSTTNDHFEDAFIETVSANILAFIRRSAPKEKYDIELNFTNKILYNYKKFTANNNEYYGSYKLKKTFKIIHKVTKKENTLLLDLSINVAQDTTKLDRFENFGDFIPSKSSCLLTLKFLSGKIVLTNIKNDWMLEVYNFKNKIRHVKPKIHKKVKAKQKMSNFYPQCMDEFYGEYSKNYDGHSEFYNIHRNCSNLKNRIQIIDHINCISEQSQKLLSVFGYHIQRAQIARLFCSTWDIADKWAIKKFRELSGNREQGFLMRLYK